jgi:hypothetical protein
MQVKRWSIQIDLFVPFLLYWSLNSQRTGLATGLLVVVVLARVLIVLVG